MILKKTIYNDDKNYAPREGEQIFGPNENRSTAESPIVQAQMAREDAAKASKRASEAVKAAGEAAEIANAVSQKVWSDDSGLHISDGNQDAAATRNTIWNSLGMLFRKGLNPILGVLTGDNPRVAIYDGQGSGEEHEVASFGESARMGKGKEAHVFVEGNRILAEDGDSDMYAVRYFDVGLIDEGDNSTTMSQTWSIEEQVTGKVFELTYYPVNLNGVAVNGASVPFQQSVDNPKQIYIPATLNVGDNVGISYTTYGANSYFTFGRRQTDSEKGYTSFAAGVNTVASGYASHAEGRDTVASGMRSHAEGVFAKAQGHESHAEGGFTSATGEYSHAENYRTTAKGKGAHAEGLNTQANGQYSHAEGNGCIADTDNSHAEGSGTRAQAYNSHAGGFCTVADSREQTVIGRFNAATRTGSGTNDDPYEYWGTGNYAFIIGNGLDDATEDRSNALAVDWDGNVKAKGDVYVNCDADSSGTAHIGQVFNWQGNLKSNLTANAGSYVEGNGSITLRGGHVYLVLAYVAMTNSTNGTVDRRAQIFNKTANSVVLTGGKFVASQVWGTVETQMIYEANEDVTLTVRGSASRPTTTIPTAWIRAVCIA